MPLEVLAAVPVRRRGGLVRRCVERCGRWPPTLARNMVCLLRKCGTADPTDLPALLGCPHRVKHGELAVRLYHDNATVSGGLWARMSLSGSQGRSWAGSALDQKQDTPFLVPLAIGSHLPHSLYVGGASREPPLARDCGLQRRRAITRRFPRRCRIPKPAFATRMVRDLQGWRKRSSIATKCMFGRDGLPSPDPRAHYSQVGERAGETAFATSRCVRGRSFTVDAASPRQPLRRAAGWHSKKRALLHLAQRHKDRLLDAWRTALVRGVGV